MRKNLYKLGGWNPIELACWILLTLSIIAGTIVMVQAYLTPMPY